jgi:hypothetical protein
MTDDGRSTGSLKPLLVIFGTTVMVSFLVAVALLRVAGAIDWRPETKAEHERLTAFIDSIRLPADLRFHSKEAVGSTLFLDDQDPRELRVYETSRDLPDLSERVASALESQGFRIKKRFDECAFSAARNGDELVVEVLRQPQQPTLITGSDCPRASWAKGYLWMLASKNFAG